MEGYRSGRPSALTQKQRHELSDILESGPVSYGLDTATWSSPIIAWVIKEEFGVTYHPGHVRKLLHDLGFSLQRPRRVLAPADAKWQDPWHRHTYPNLKPQTKALAQNWVLIFSRRGRFRQNSTRQAQPNRGPSGSPATGQRMSLKIFDALGCRP